jgi:IPT/TIG domain
MPHDAATYAPTAVSFDTPKEVAERVLDEVEDARSEYAQGVRSTYAQYSYLTAGTLPPITPDITGFTPESLPMDEEATPVEVVVNGSGFVAESVVNWDGDPITPTAQTATTLTVTVPSSTWVQGVPVYVSNSGLLSNEKNFKFTSLVAEDEQMQNKSYKTKKR